MYILQEFLISLIIKTSFKILANWGGDSPGSKCRSSLGDPRLARGLLGELSKACI